MSKTTSGLDDITLSLDALVRSVEVNKNASHAIFLGAGASISSGVPSAWNCLWQWKRNIFLTKNHGLESQFQDLSLTGVKQRIQDWLDAEGRYPPTDSPEEYSFYIEQCYPISDDRRQYFQELSKDKQPYIGYKLLCLLAEADIIKSVWTTNFDNLVVRAANQCGLAPIEISLDASFRITRQPRKGELLHVALHGDYRYDLLKNTKKELRNQDIQLQNALAHYGQDVSLIVAGYSGRDESIMNALQQAFGCPGAGRLYWCGMEGSDPPAGVIALLELARANGRIAYYVPTQGFDDLMGRLALHCLNNKNLESANKLYSEMIRDIATESPPFEISSKKFNSVLRSNLFYIEVPLEVYQFTPENLSGEGSWKEMRELTANSNVCSALLRGKVLAIGSINEIKSVFKNQIAGEIERTPINEKELSFNDGIIIGLLLESLVKVIAEKCSLETDGKRIWSLESRRKEKIYGQNCFVYDAVTFGLRRFLGKQYLVVKPTLKGTTLTNIDLDVDYEKEMRRVLLTKQYNEQFNNAITYWSEILFDRKRVIFEIGSGSGAPFRYNILGIPVLAQINSTTKWLKDINSTNINSATKFTGEEYPEPKLVFSNKSGNGSILDHHPIHGIVTYRPYDYALSQQGIGQEIRVGVICPATESNYFARSLSLLHNQSRPDSKPSYLLDFPGIHQAFGIPVTIPQPNLNGWLYCTEPKSSISVERSAVELARNITASINSLNSSYTPHVIIICIPERWRNLEEFESDGERFDLHDYIKAYCVQRGIATQFVREDTFKKPYKCEVLWWLSLSIYVKSMRTPWILQNADRDTAYMGLGYGIDSSAGRGKHFLIGCSHIYSAEGLGLKYLLSKVENPIMRKGNPHLSREDGRRIGDGVRQLFFDSRNRLPKRVVIHKRTPFLPEEKQGLLEGLADVDIIDMLEITVEPLMRFVAAHMVNDKPQLDKFPVRRNTVTVLDKKRALLWVHGTADAVVPNKQYYLGASRIPAPLLVTRHYGSSSLGLLAREIFGLSKMNWNTFDMYAKLPATIQSSNEIARIGILLERLGAIPYDYRLFI